MFLYPKDRKNIRSFVETQDQNSPYASSQSKINSITDLLKDKISHDEFMIRGRELAATPGGFINADLRTCMYRRAFKIIDPSVQTVLDNDEIKAKYNLPAKEGVQKDDRTIEVDVERSIINRTFDNFSKALRSRLKEEMKELLRTFIRLNNGRYGYFQGFHDFSLYLYLTTKLDKDLTLCLMQNLAEFFFRDYMKEKGGIQIHNTFEFLLQMVNRILSKKGKSKLSSEDLYFSVSWVLTWFTYRISDYSTVMRLYDFLIFNSPKAVYLLSAVVAK